MTELTATARALLRDITEHTEDGPVVRTDDPLLVAVVQAHAQVAMASALDRLAKAINTLEIPSPTGCGRGAC